MSRPRPTIDVNSEDDEEESSNSYSDVEEDFSDKDELGEVKLIDSTDVSIEKQQAACYYLAVFVIVATIATLFTASEYTYNYGHFGRIEHDRWFVVPVNILRQNINYCSLLLALVGCIGASGYRHFNLFIVCLVSLCSLLGGSDHFVVLLWVAGSRSVSRSVLRLESSRADSFADGNLPGSHDRRH